MGSDRLYYNDFPLVAQYFSGSGNRDETLSFVFVQFNRYIYTIARNRVNPAVTGTTPEDVVGSTMVKIVSGFDDYHGLCPLRQWIARITVNEVKDVYRRSLASRFMYHDSIDSMADRLVGQDTTERHLVSASVMELVSSDDLEVLYLHYVEGFEWKEIAALRGVPLSTLKVQMLRKKELLRKLIIKRSSR